MKRLILVGLALGVIGTIALAAAAAARPDGAVIHNSGSTNTSGYSIKLWSNGRGELTMGRGPGWGTGRVFELDQSVAERFFSNVKAARQDPGTPGHCMKSASFGTSTTVQWHGWSSPDLQCPPLSSAVQAVAADVRDIQQAASIGNQLRRIPLPREPRMIPSTAPEVSPT
jgi:hypothetical protein